jgi:hypothetical protein
MTLWRSVFLGVISTASMDLLSVFAIRLRLMAPLSPNLIGRWFASVARAHPFHADIAHAAPVGHELAIAVPVHYTIGVALSALFVWGMSQLGWSPRNPALALAFGVSTSLLPWLIMFPAMGYGFFGSHGPAGTRLFLSSLTSHAFFGLGIWAGVRIVGGW